jgi:hypothetical protein
LDEPSPIRLGRLAVPRVSKPDAELCRILLIEIHLSKTRVFERPEAGSILGLM